MTQFGIKYKRAKLVKYTRRETERRFYVSAPDLDAALEKLYAKEGKQGDVKLTLLSAWMRTRLGWRHLHTWN